MRLKPIVSSTKRGNGFRCFILLGTVIGLSYLLCGCSSIGPKTILRDRFDYSTAIATSWKRQMLLNIVKLRYGEPPLFMDVASVINQYELRGEVSAGASFTEGLLADRYDIGGSANYYDRPTVTYQPLTGQKFNLSMLTPIKPERLLALVQAGYSIKFVFRIGVRAINGIKNSRHTVELSQAEDPMFTKILDALKRIQGSGMLTIRFKQKESGEKMVVFFSHQIQDEKIQRDIEFVRKTLGLARGINEFTLAFGLLPENDREIAVLSHSMLDILLELSAQIEVPPKHLTDGRAWNVDHAHQSNPLIRIHSHTEQPEDVFSAVKFRDHWFWIDDKDLYSKQVMSFMMILFSLAESQKPAQVPVVTVGAGP